MANHELMNVTPTKSPSDKALSPRRSDAPSLQKAKLQPISGLLAKLLYEWYGILENPFGVTPNARCLYESKTHAEARSSLIVGIESGIGFQALIAPPGMGKTTILFQVLERFKDVARTALLFQIHGDSHDFLRYLLSELGSDASDSSATRLQEAINQLLVREFRSGRRAIVVIDEAQSLDTPVLETIRLLSNFETQSEKLLQIILAGQPQLAQRLANPEMAQLYQRISILTRLIPFGLKDTSNYIEHRLKIAGYLGPPLFTSAALRLIWERSGGIPREINTLCFNALLLARTAEQKQIDSDILSEVVADRDLDCLHFNTEIHASVMRGVQTANRPRLGNAASDPAATSSNKICKAAVSGAKAEADDASTRPTTFDGIDLVQLKTIATKIVSTSSGRNADQAAVPGAGTESDDIVGRAFLPDTPALVTHHKTDVVTFADAPAGGLPSCETAAMMRPNLTEQQLSAIASPGSGDRFDQQLVAWFALCGGAWSGTAAELLAAVKTRVGVGNDLCAQSPSVLYAHIESHEQILRSLGVHVSLRHGYPRMVSLRSCEDDKSARKPMSVNEALISSFPPRSKAAWIGNRARRPEEGNREYNAPLRLNKSHA